MIDGQQGRLILYAPSVHEGGGLTLLKLLLKVVNNKTTYAILDSRLPKQLSLSNDLNCYKAKTGIIGRYSAEKHLQIIATPDDVVLCFGNLPPLYALRSKRLFLFLQNRYLLSAGFPDGTDFKLMLSLTLQRWWLKFKAKAITQFIVQTPSMQLAAGNLAGGTNNVLCMPLVGGIMNYQRAIVSNAKIDDKKYDFVYVASGLPHKNHKKLIEAWVLLAKDKIYPTLCITLSEQQQAKLCSYIEEQKSAYDLKITNVGSVLHDEVLALYKTASALIYPSLLESFGLPLLEAREAGLSIVASELDYVRDAIDPEESFDPNSAVSIARAVKRFFNLPEANLPLVDGKQFLDKITADSKK